MRRLRARAFRWTPRRPVPRVARCRPPRRRGAVCTGALTTTFIGSRTAATQPLLSSAYAGFGTKSLTHDAEDVLTFLSHLRGEYGVRRFVLVGHSTGCQDILKLFELAGLHAAGAADTNVACSARAVDGRLFAVVPSIEAVVLHAPVSDTDGFGVAKSGAAECVPEERASTPAACQSGAEEGSARVERLLDKPRLSLGEAVAVAEHHFGVGNPEAVVSNFRLYGSPVTARRLVSLTQHRTDDDFFSLGLSEEYLHARLSHVPSVPVLLLCCLDDEYVPHGSGCEYVVAAGRQLRDALLRRRPAHSAQQVRMVFGHWRHDGTKCSGASGVKDEGVCAVDDETVVPSILDFLKTVW